MDVLLQPGQHVDLVLDGGWRRHATVLATAPGAVDLRPDGDGSLLPGTLTWVPAAVEWRTPSGAGRLAGVLHRGGEGVLRLEGGAAPVTMQRRRFVRVRAEVPAAVIAPQAKVLARTVDVSVGGMLLADAPALAVGDAIRFALRLDGLEVAGEGQVVRGTPDGGRAVCFADLEPRGERALSRFVADSQRRHRALA